MNCAKVQRWKLIENFERKKNHSKKQRPKRKSAMADTIEAPSNREWKERGCRFIVLSLHLSSSHHQWPQFKRIKWNSMDTSVKNVSVFDNVFITWALSSFLSLISFWCITPINKATIICRNRKQWEQWMSKKRKKKKKKNRIFGIASANEYL